MNKQRFDMPLKIKSVENSGEFSGYGSVFGVEDSYGDVVVQGAFAKSLKTKKPAMLWQHNAAEPIGVYTKVVEDENGLYVEGRLLIDDDPLAKRAHAHLKAGSISGLSIGFNLVDWAYDQQLGVFKLLEIDLWEVSLVTFPANESARIENVKSSLMQGETPAPKTVERLLRDAGFSRQQAKAFMSQGYGAIHQRDADDGAELLKTLTVTTLFK